MTDFLRNSIFGISFGKMDQLLPVIATEEESGALQGTGPLLVLSSASVF